VHQTLLVHWSIHPAVHTNRKFKKMKLTKATILSVLLLPTRVASTTPDNTYTSSKTGHFYEYYFYDTWCPPPSQCDQPAAVTFAAGLPLKCNNVAAHLVDITTQDEEYEIYIFLAPIYKYHSIAWLGLTYDFTSNNDKWLLSDGLTTANYFHWDTGGSTGSTAYNNPYSSFPCAYIYIYQGSIRWENDFCTDTGADVLVEYGCGDTKAPVSTAPITKPPVSTTPITKPPVSTAPITKPPVSTAPITKAPNSKTPVAASTAPLFASKAPVTVTQTPVVASKAPIVTSTAPVFTSKKPVTGSKAPVVASMAPVTTSKAPLVASMAPVSTSNAPVMASKTPVTASKAPVNASKVPVVASKAPVIDNALVTASKAPVVASNAPVTASKAPVVTSETPVTASTAPVVASKAPVVASKAPVIASKAPVIASKAPVIASKAPVTASKAPVTASKAPVTASKAPGVASKAPGVASKAPGVASKAPVVASKAPVVASMAPVVASKAPVVVSNGPASKFSVSVAPTSKRYPVNIKACVQQVFLNKNCQCVTIHRGKGKKPTRALKCPQDLVNKDFKFCIAEYKTKNKLNRKKDVQTYTTKLHKAFDNVCKKKHRKKHKKVTR
jgi:hypothetical protein